MFYSTTLTPRGQPHRTTHYLNTKSPAGPDQVVNLSQTTYAIVCATCRRRGFPTARIYFDGLVAVAALVFFGAFFIFLVCFLVLVVGAACVPVLLLAGAAGVDCANVKGIVAAASAITSKLFFIFPSFRARLPAHNSMLSLKR